MLEHSKYSIDFLYQIALEFVPGFRVVLPKKEGAKTKWNDLKLLVLWRAVQEKINKSKKSARSACNILSRQEPWRSLLRGTNEQRHARLYKIYMENLKSPFVVLLQNAMTAGIGEDWADEFVAMIEDYEKNNLPHIAAKATSQKKKLVRKLEFLVFGKSTYVV